MRGEWTCLQRVDVEARAQIRKAAATSGRGEHARPHSRWPTCLCQRAATQKPSPASHAHAPQACVWLLFVQEACVPTSLRIMTNDARLFLHAKVYPSVFDSRSAFCAFAVPLLVSGAATHVCVWSPVSVLVRYDYAPPPPPPPPLPPAPYLPLYV